MNGVIEMAELPQFMHFRFIGKNNTQVVVEEVKDIVFAPVQHGKWIIDREFGNDVMSGEQMVICSVCQKGIFWGKQNYCPNCGARMDGET